MSLALCFSMEEALFDAVAEIASNVGVNLKRIPTADFKTPLQALIFGGSAERDSESKGFSEPMMVLCPTDDGSDDRFLTALREKGISRFILKAYLTETNAKWTPETLFRHICDERETFRKAAK